MQADRRRFAAGLALSSLPLAVTLPARAAVPAEGAQFQVLKPPVDVPPGPKVQVIEFFTYACPHCFEFEPTLEAWLAQRPPNVEFRRVPVPYLFNAENFQRLYYTLEALGKVDEAQGLVFRTVHLEHQRLGNPQDMAAMMTKVGVDSARFLSLFNSFSIAAKVRQAKQTCEAYQVDQFPTLAVQGRYKTTPGSAGGAAEALRVVDYLVQRAAGRA
jgi:thiol:disulfide interchange protein DsbA